MARDVSKLPRWAQERIINLEGRVRELEAEVDKGVVGSKFPRSNLHLLSESGYADWRPSRYEAGRIMLGPHWNDFVDFRYADNPGEPTVYIYSGFSRLGVSPSAGNAIFLSIKK